VRFGLLRVVGCRMISVVPQQQRNGGVVVPATGYMTFSSAFLSLSSYNIIPSW